MQIAMTGLVDAFGRRITYLRLSVTDRCDLRCVYCMPKQMKFLPKADILTLDELYSIALAFMRNGVRKIRLTGGEPLVRRDVGDLVQALGAHVGKELDELTLTTNGTRLTEFAPLLAGAGVRRVNVSLDTLDPETFFKLTRGDILARVMDGIAAAARAGLAIKINTVALKGINQDELPSLVQWAHERGHTITLIEVMPMGDVGEDRIIHHLPLDIVKQALEERWTLIPSSDTTGGPARYFDLAETGGRLGLITPLTNNFCAGCNRVRVTATGQLYTCLGGENRADLRAALRSGDAEALNAALATAMRQKQHRHSFSIEKQEGSNEVSRHMSVTGG